MSPVPYKGKVHLARSVVSGLQAHNQEPLCLQASGVLPKLATTLQPVTCGGCIRCWGSLPANIRQMALAR